MQTHVPSNTYVLGIGVILYYAELGWDMNQRYDMVYCAYLEDVVQTMQEELIN